jgi:AcrR family transcriptional regulator
MPKAREAHPARRRYTEDALLDAARAVFHEHGYAATQVPEIAKRAGTTKPTLYARLGGKEEIFTKVLEREAELLRSWLLEAYMRAQDLSLHGMVDAALKPFFRFARERRAGFELLFGTEPGLPGSAVGQEFLRDILEPVTSLIQARIRSVGGDAQAVSAGAVAVATIGVTLHLGIYAIEKGLDLDAVSDVGTAYVDGAFRSLDLSALGRLDRAS